MLPFFTTKYNNPHSQHTRHNDSIIKGIEKARTDIAKLVGADKDFIGFYLSQMESF